MKISCEAVRSRDLKPGDLFSTRGPSYWDSAVNGASIGEKVYIRTNELPHNPPEPDAQLFRITIEVGG